MSRKKKPSNNAQAMYDEHLRGVFTNRNPEDNRQRRIEAMYIRILTEHCVNRFQWHGLPESVDVRFLELTLFYNALSVFYYDNQFEQYLALKGASSGRPNMLDQPTAFHVTGNTFISKTLSAAHCVPIWANYTRMPDTDIVAIYAHKLAHLDRTIEINSSNARQPRVLVTTDNTKLSVENFNRQIDEGVLTMKVDPAMQDVAAVLDMGINPDTIEKLSIVKQRLWNECMGYLGIDNANQDKKERLVAAEVDANVEQTQTAKDVNLNARRQAAELINRRYKMNVSVDYGTAERDAMAALQTIQAGNGDM